MTKPTAPDAYDAFARFYDAFTAGSDYETWTTHVLALAAKHGLAGTQMLDVACGTGKSFVPFVERGFEVTACDISPAMLALAAEKAPDVRLIEADMRHLPALGTYDLVTCFDDSLNHLLEEDDLAATLAAMEANLDRGGLLLFDLNTLLAYRTTFAADDISVQDGTTFLWRGKSSSDAPPGCSAAFQIDAFIPRQDGLYEHSSTHHTQRHFPPHLVTAILADAGLTCVGVYGVLHDGSLVAQVDETAQLKALYAATPAKE